MKILLKSLIIITFFSFTYPIKAQETSLINPDKNNFKSIIKIEVAQGGIQFENKNKKKTSLVLSLQYSFAGLANKDKYDFQITPEYRFYLSQKREWPEGFYLGNYIFYKDYVVARDMKSNGLMIYSKDLVKTAGFGLKLGYQRKLTNRIPIDFAMGLGYNVFRDVTHIFGIEIIKESTHYLNFTGGLSIGYIF
jgi:hypothetical protein